MTDTAYATQDGWERAWDRMVAAIGQDFSGGGTNIAVDAVERGWIRKYCEPLEFDCPLHHDEAVAKRYGYRGIVAPYSGISSTWTDMGQWSPGMPTNYPQAEPNYNNINRGWGGGGGGALPSPPTTAGFATDIEIEYFEPVCVGDRLTSSGRKLLSVLPRETSVGRGAFMIWEKETRNQRGDLVAQVRNGGYLYVPHQRPAGAASGGGRAAPLPSGPIMEATPPREPLPPERRADWGKQLMFEDVREGDAVPPVVFHVTVFRLVVEAGANRDFNQIHHNTPVTQAQGAPDMYANNIFIQGMWERTVREFIGLGGRLKKTGPFRMKIFNNVGESVVTMGTVKRTWVEGNEHFVELEIWSENSRGVSVGPGPVIATLPASR